MDLFSFFGSAVRLQLQLLLDTTLTRWSWLSMFAGHTWRPAALICRTPFSVTSWRSQDWPLVDLMDGNFLSFFEHWFSIKNFVFGLSRLNKSTLQHSPCHWPLLAKSDAPAGTLVNGPHAFGRNYTVRQQAIQCSVMLQLTCFVVVWYEWSYLVLHGFHFSWISGLMFVFCMVQPKLWSRDVIQWSWPRHHQMDSFWLPLDRARRNSLTRPLGKASACQ